MKKLNVRNLATCGLLIAFSVVLSRFASFRFAIGGVENIRFGLGTLPIMLSGILFGPIFGGLVGICADLLGMVVSPMGAYMPQFTFVSMLYGVIPPLFCFPFQFSSYKTQMSYRLRVYFGIFLGQAIPQLLFLPYFQLILFKVPYTLSFIPRLITVPIQFLVSLLVFSFLLRVFKESISGR
jgi:ECF transporter S component (folate family)